MSGGTWEYVQYRIEDVLDTLREYIRDAKKRYTEEEIKENPDLSQFEPGDYKNLIEGDDETIEIFKEGLVSVAKAIVYIQRFDWLLAGDDGIDSFKRRLKEELSEVDDKAADGSLFKTRYGEED